MSDSIDLERHLESRSLLGYQIDASHLHDVIQGIIRQLNAQSTTSNRRFSQLENAVSDLDKRVGRIEQAFGDISDPSEVRNMRDDLRSASKVIDEIQRHHLPSLQRACEEGKLRATANEKNIQALNAIVSPISSQQARFGQSLDDLTHQLQQLAGRESERSRDRDIMDRIGAAINDLGARQTTSEKEHQQMQREINTLANEQTDGRWREALEELNVRMNENFRLVEKGANAVDIELGKFRTDLANLRAEVNTLDNNTRYRFGKTTDDFDEKFKMLIDTLRAFETNSSAMEDAISSAGKALATNRHNRQSAISQLARGSSLSPSASGLPPSTRGQTSTDTNLRGGYLTTDQGIAPTSSNRRDW